MADWVVSKENQKKTKKPELNIGGAACQREPLPPPSSSPHVVATVDIQLRSSAGVTAEKGAALGFLAYLLLLFFLFDALGKATQPPPRCWLF
jgi:hypothetical protein